jgi:hypothetical protein
MMIKRGEIIRMTHLDTIYDASSLEAIANDCDQIPRSILGNNVTDEENFCCGRVIRSNKKCR